MTESKAMELLRSKKKKDVLSALRAIKRDKLYGLCDEIYSIFLIICNIPTKWEEQAAMIEVFGLAAFQPCTAKISAICEKAESFDLVSTFAATCWVRLKRTSLTDMGPVFYLLDKKSYSLNMGALNAVGYDQMMPSDHEILELIRICRDIHVGIPAGYSDPRYGLAAAAVNWNPDLVKDFLEYCLNAPDTPLQYIATNSLKRKKVTLR